MFGSALSRVGFIAPPASLTMPAAGIDISAGGAKFVHLGRAHGHLALLSYGEVPLQEGVIVDGDLEKPEVLTDVLRSIRLKNRVRYAVASLSERKSYLYQIMVPPDQKNLKEAVEFDLEAHVPLPPAETLFDFEVARRTSSGTIVSVTAFAKRIVESYERAFQKSGVILRSLEIESHALVRAALDAGDREHVVMVVDMGKRSTRIAVADHGTLSYTATVDFGGDMLTTALMKRFSIEAPAAEEMKNARGFLLGKDNTDVVEAVVGSISVLRDELLRNQSYWNSPSEDGIARDPIDHVIIAGGNANMLGLAEYLSDALRVPVTIANVWQNVFSLNQYVPPMQRSESLEYAPAIGLAQKFSTNSIW